MINYLKHTAVLLLVASLCSCKTRTTISKMETVTLDSSQHIKATHEQALISRVDTLHDSVFVREVVTAEGEVKYKEHIVYRDRKATNVQYITHHDTIYKVAKTTSKVEAQTTAQPKSTRKGRFADIFSLVCIALYLFLAYRIIKMVNQ